MAALSRLLSDSVDWHDAAAVPLSRGRADIYLFIGRESRTAGYLRKNTSAASALIVDARTRRAGAAA